MRLAAVLLLASLASPAPVERGKRSLTDALRVALGGRQVPVLVVVDATPYTRAAAETIGNSLHDLERTPGPWRFARLGEKPLRSQPTAAALTIQLTEVLAEPTNEVSILRALRRTLAAFPDRGGRIVYLADWRFEDDEGLERRRRRRAEGQAPAARRPASSAWATIAGLERRPHLSQLQ